MSKNTHLLKVSGTSELPEPLQMDEDYEIFLKAGVVSISKKSDQDGGFTFVYNAKQIHGEVKNRLGKTIQTQDRKSQSKKLRGQLVNMALETGIPPEQVDDWYEQTMVKIRHFLPDILRFLHGLEGLDKIN